MRVGTTLRSTAGRRFAASSLLPAASATTWGSVPSCPQGSELKRTERTRESERQAQIQSPPVQPDALGFDYSAFDPARWFLRPRPKRPPVARQRPARPVPAPSMNSKREVGWKKNSPSPRPSPPGRGRSCSRVLARRLRRIGIGSCAARRFKRSKLSRSSQALTLPAPTAVNSGCHQFLDFTIQSPAKPVADDFQIVMRL